tara:strand:- start:6 stop:371 length:366 start_codon:yes stop_codon:yes gene_type:complete
MAPTSQLINQRFPQHVAVKIERYLLKIGFYPVLVGIVTKDKGSTFDINKYEFEECDCCSGGFFIGNIHKGRCKCYDLYRGGCKHCSTYPKFEGHKCICSNPGGCQRMYCIMGKDVNEPMKL